MRLFEIENNLIYIDVDDDEGRGNASGYVVDSLAEQLPNWLAKYNIYDNSIVENIRTHYNRIAFLNNINVDEEYQGKGIGSSLLEDFISECMNNSAESILLVSDKHESQKEGFILQQWYERHEFKIIFENDIGFLMVLPLDKY